MDGKKVKEIISGVIKDIQEKEDDCYEQIRFMNEHGFKMEGEAIRYRQQAFNRSWLMVSRALDRISELEE